MAFANLFFIFAFLPLCLLLYFAMPWKGKNTVLLLCSLVFFSWGKPAYLPLLLLLIVFHYLSGREMEALLAKGRKRRLRMVLISAAAFDILLLCFFKYLAGYVGGKALPMPLGVSYFTFSLLSFLFDVYRGKAPAPHNILDFGLYTAFFPKLSSGPIVRYGEMEPQMKRHRFTWEKFGRGSRKFIVGLSKKVLLANTLGDTFNNLSALPPGQLSASGAWLCALSYSLMLYFDFGGYSDMAIGLAEMFGFRFEKNFDYPYLSKTVAEFWRRWHISLGAWFKEYVYFPLGGSREGTLRTILNLMAVWLLTGIWHGTGACFLLWGIYYGVLLILEKFVLHKVLELLPGALRHVLTLLCVVVGWVLFFSPSPGAAFTLLGRMFGTGSFSNGTALYYWGVSWRVMLAGALACLPVWSGLGRRLMESGRKWFPLSLIAYGVLLILCIAGMMNDTYSTFLYAQF